MKALWRLITVATALALSMPAWGQATVFVPEEAGMAWWATDLSLLPLNRSDGGVSVEDIDAWINKNRGMKTNSKTCYMNFLKDDQIVSPVRSTNNEIRETLEEFPNSFAQSFEPSPGQFFQVRVGIFEDCEESDPASPPLKFMAIVITDDHGKIRGFDALEWSFLRLFKSDDGTLTVYGCFACGERQQLEWDSGNQRFYYMWTGH